MSINPVDHPVLEAISNRWSPYRFDPRSVEDEKILCCLEAARWAASSFNEQPWTWIVARRQDTEQFDRMVGCLMEANQGWASNAGVLMLTVLRTTFAYNNRPNRVALHDLGQAAACMALQASDLGLQVHQMAGVNLSQIRQEYGIPEGFEPQTAIALGYPATDQPVNEQEKQWRDRESAARKRRPLGEQVFGHRWGSSADFTA